MLKKLLLLWITTFFGPEISAQKVSDKWYAKASIADTVSHFLLDVRKNGAGYEGYLDLPSRGLFRMRLDSIAVLNDDQVYFAHSGLDMIFRGALETKTDEIPGMLKTDGISYRLIFSRKPQVKRNQVVQEPVSYTSREINFFNQDSTRLSGTLTIPKDGDSFTAVVLISGSGPQNRDEEILGHKPFQILILRQYPETYDRDYPFFESVYRDMADISDKEVLKDSLQAKFERLATQMSEDELSVYGGVDTYVKNQVASHTSDWYHYYLQFDVTPYLEKLKIPILALNGDKDSSMEPRVNLGGIENTLRRSGNSSFKTVELKNVNHFFQVSEDNQIESVYFNEETFSKEALSIITDWVTRF